MTEIKYPPIDEITKPFLLTEEYCFYFHIKPQTARTHRMKDCEIVKSVKVGNRNYYPTEACKAKIKEILSGGEV